MKLSRCSYHRAARGGSLSSSWPHARRVYNQCWPPRPARDGGARVVSQVLSVELLSVSPPPPPPPPLRPIMVRFPSSSSASAVVLALLAGAPSPAQAVDVTVSLDYSTYIGTAQSGTGVSEWLGIRFAAPPLGDLRFARPQDPVVVSTPQPANQVCLSLAGVKLLVPHGPWAQTRELTSVVPAW